MIENWNLCWQMIARVRNSMDGWGGGPGPLPQSKVKALHATITHLYCHPIQGLSTSAHVGRMACVHAWPRRGVGGVMANTPTHTKCSHATLCHTRLPCVPFKNSWVNKQAELADHALCLSDSYLAYMYMYFRDFKFHINPMKLKYIREEQIARRPLLKREGRASTWPAAHFRPLSAAQKGLFFSSCIQFNTATSMIMGTCYFFRSQLPLVHYLETVLPLPAGPQLSKIWKSASAGPLFRYRYFFRSALPLVRNSTILLPLFSL
jgi:hypothetical protein